MAGHVMSKPNSHRGNLTKPVPETYGDKASNKSKSKNKTASNWSTTLPSSFAFLTTPHNNIIIIIITFPQLKRIKKDQVWW